MHSISDIIFVLEYKADEGSGKLCYCCRAEGWQ